MADEILTLMNTRTFKDKDKDQYNQVNILIKNKICKAKQHWLEDKCTEIEELATKYDSFNMHKRMKELSGGNNRKQASILKDQQEDIVVDIKEKLKIWQQFVEDLFEDERHTML
ncbi:hypothetical protein HUJ05_009825 [Dendroctonus ponderosae]|nr:hypothetical protein HUJ05_009825 [Dendroctonus ponderosae]